MNYQYIIDSSFQPFSMQEMLVPLTAYKDAYEKDEERYLELQNKAGDLAAVVASLPEESAVRKQYENYYNELNKRAKEFSNNGKSFSTGKALLDLRRRYQGEIGSIEKANNALNEELKLRRTIMAQDPTMLYNMENPTLENYMPGAKRNDYSISGNYLSAEGAKMGEALSKRMFTTEEGKNNILGGYYIDYVQRTGVRDTKAFMQSPEFAEAMKQDLMSKGVYDNLSGNALQRAIDAYRSGAMKGFVYSESHSPQRDLGEIDASTQANLDLQRRSQNISLAAQGLTYDDKTGKVTYNMDNDPAVEKAKAIAIAKEEAKQNSGGKSVKSSSGTAHSTQLPNRLRIKWNGNDPINGTATDYNDYTTEIVADDDLTLSGNPVEYDDLPQILKDVVNKSIKNNSADDYDIYYKPFKGGTFNDDEAEIEIVPRKPYTTDKDNGEEMNWGILK